YGSTQAEVLQKAAAARKAHAEGRRPTPDRSSVRAFLESWLEGVKSSARPKTYESYEGIVRVHLVPVIGGIQLVKLSPSDVQSMVARLSRSTRSKKVTAKGTKPEKLSPRTVEYALLVLRRALNVAVSWGMV